MTALPPVTEIKVHHCLRFELGIRIIMEKDLIKYACAHRLSCTLLLYSSDYCADDDLLHIYLAQLRTFRSTVLLYQYIA